jgi:thymidylate synthase (FAD)
LTLVLDKGEVILIDSMAGDHKPIGAARVSTGKRPEDSLRGDASDKHLLETLMTGGHGSPFEHAVFQWYVKEPLFVIREHQRHRVASYNEQSGRYSKFKSEFYIPSQVRTQDPKNKQSSVRSDDEELFREYEAAINASTEEAFERYEHLLSIGVAREMARMVLPLNLYSSFWWTVNSRSLMNFLMLRNAPSAQWEMVQYAKAFESDFARLMPWTYEAFVSNGRVAP